MQTKLVAPVLPVTVVPHPDTGQQNSYTGHIVETPPTHKDGWDKAGVCINATLAVFAALACWLTWRTLNAIKRQSQKMTEQNALIEKNLNLQYRPRLLVRIDFVEASSVAPVGTEPIGRIQFGIANVGGSSATVTEARLGIQCLQNERVRREMHGLAYLEVGKVAAGARKTMLLNLAGGINKAIRRAELSMEGLRTGGDHPLIVFAGEVKYRDALGIERATGVWRTYDPGRGTFIPVDDPDREFSD